jgi:hypothetical protein
MMRIAHREPSPLAAGGRIVRDSMRQTHRDVAVDLK